MPQKIVNFPESTARSRSQTVNIPNLTSVNSVTVNTGNVTHSVNGEDVTVNVSNGASTRSTSYTPSKTGTGYRTGSAGTGFPSSISYNDGTYSGSIPLTSGPYLASGSAADSKTVSQSGTTTATNTWTWTDGTWVKYNTSYSPSSISYNDGTYSGTLPLQSTSAGAPYPSGSGAYNGQQTNTSGSPGSATFSGTVSKPDTRVYRADYSGTVYAATQYTYYYAYTVTIDYVDRVKVGAHKIQTQTVLITLPLYDPTVGMDGVNQLKISENGSVACFELVDVTHEKASPLRIQTTGGLKAIAKE